MCKTYTENYKTFLREIKEDLNKWRAIPHLRIGKFNIVMMSSLPDWFIDSMKSQSKFQQCFCNRHCQTDLYGTVNNLEQQGLILKRTKLEELF